MNRMTYCDYCDTEIKKMTEGENKKLQKNLL